MIEDARLPWSLWRRRALLCGGAGLLLWLGGAIFSPRAGFRAYWFAWIFWSELGLGALLLCLLQFLTRGAWSLVVQRPLEAALTTLPLMALLFFPALLGARDIFPWATPDALLNAPHKHAFLTLPWFTVRTLLCFGLLAPLAFRLRFWSAREDQSVMQPDPAARLRALGAGGLVLCSICLLFASTDWIMSLEPKWYSTMFVVIFGIGALLTALAASIAFVLLLPPQTGYAALLNVKCLRDLGNLLMAFVIFWTYVSFSQFLIIWSGNLPREIGWYLHRSTPGWQAVVAGLALLQFAVPFALLLSRATKRSPQRLASVAILVFFMNAVNAAWLIIPSFEGSQIVTLILCAPAWVGLGGLWVAVFVAAFQTRPAVPRIAMESMPGEVLHA